MARTQAQTPAPKKDRIKGSAKNPKGSASGSRGGIAISKQAETAIKNLLDKHNDRYNAKSKKVDMGDHAYWVLGMGGVGITVGVAVSRIIEHLGAIRRIK